MCVYEGVCIEYSAAFWKPQFVIYSVATFEPNEMEVEIYVYNVFKNIIKKKRCVHETRLI